MENLVQEKHYACESFSFKVSKTLQIAEVTSPQIIIFTLLQLVISLNICPIPRTLSCLISFRNSFFQLRKSRNYWKLVESKVVVGVVGVEILVAVELLHASPPPHPELPKGTTSIDAWSFKVRASRGNAALLGHSQQVQIYYTS